MDFLSVAIVLLSFWALETMVFLLSYSVYVRD